MRWLSLQSASPLASFFQSVEACEFFSRCGAMGTYVVGVERHGMLKGVIVAMLYHEGRWPKSRLSARAIVNGGPLVAPDIDDDALRSLLLACLHDLRRRYVYTEIRNFHDYSRWRHLFEACGLRYEPHYNFHIDLAHYDAQKQLSSARRYELRRATREGVAVDINPTEADISAFYRILCHLYSHRVKRPLPTLQFFAALCRQPFAHCILGKHQGRVVGGTLCVGLPGQPLYEWYACGDNSAGAHLYPSTVATYGAIDYALAHGHPLFDMMGAGSPGDGGYGVRDFKAQFGGQLVEHGRYIHVNQRLIYQAGKAYLKIMG